MHSLCMQVSAADAALDQSLEDQGVRRVISALHAHTWPGLQMKGQANGHSADSADAAAMPSTSGHAGGPPGHAAEQAAGSSAAEGSLPGAQPNGHAHAGNEPEATGSGMQQLPGGGAASRILDGVAEQGEGADGEFERLMGSLSSMRGQLAGLPDEERRTRAADLALQMMSAFGLEEEDSEDEE